MGDLFHGADGNLTRNASGIIANTCAVTAPDPACWEQSCHVPSSLIATFSGITECASFVVNGQLETLDRTGATATLNTAFLLHRLVLPAAAEALVNPRACIVWRGEFPAGIFRHWNNATGFGDPDLTFTDVFWRIDVNCFGTFFEVAVDITNPFNNLQGYVFIGGPVVGGTDRGFFPTGNLLAGANFDNNTACANNETFGFGGNFSIPLCP